MFPSCFSSSSFKVLQCPNAIPLSRHTSVGRSAGEKPQSLGLGCWRGCRPVSGFPALSGAWSLPRCFLPALRGVLVCSPLPCYHQACEPRRWVGTQPPSFIALGLGAVLVWGHHLSGRMFAQVSLSQSHGATTGGGRRRSFGIVAAAGVVNQADEQCILLPGYFTTPGLHHTHPLQADLVGPGRTGTRGRDAGGESVQECSL